jgi:glycosyltransferase involved in cell wall biosynthesis
MKILVSAYACHPPTSRDFQDEENILGAGESILGWNLVKEISRRHDVWVITQARNRPGIERAVRQGEMPGVHFTYWDLAGWPKRLWYSQLPLHAYYYAWQARVLSLAQALHRRVRFDLAHHATFANYWMPSFIGAFLPVPFVWGPLGGGQQTPKSFQSVYPWKARVSESVRSGSQWMGRTLLYSHHRCLERAHSVLVCNRETQACLPARYDSKIAFFPVNGISAEEIAAPRPGRAAGGPFRVLTTGRLIYWKNFGAAIRAFAAFRAQRPDAVFDIVGEGEEAGRLRALARELRVEESVHFMDWLPQKELMDKMRGSDVFLYPSLREGGGAVVVEAMACGLPAIVLDNAGPGFHVTPSWGVKIRPSDPESIVAEMSAALVSLRTDAARRLSLGEAARRRTLDYYAWDRLGERLEVIYQGAVRPLTRS